MIKLRNITLLIFLILLLLTISVYAQSDEVLNAEVSLNMNDYTAEMIRNEYQSLLKALGNEKGIGGPNSKNRTQILRTEAWGVSAIEKTVWNTDGSIIIYDLYAMKNGQLIWEHEEPNKSPLNHFKITVSEDDSLFSSNSNNSSSYSNSQVAEKDEKLPKYIHHFRYNTDDKDALEEPGKIIKWNYDLIVERANKDGIEISGVLDYCPKWASDPESPWNYGHNPPKFLDPDTYPPNYTPGENNPNIWSNFVYNTVKRYNGKQGSKGNIKYWEIWNEQNNRDFWYPNGQDSKERSDKFYQMLKVAYNAAKAANPECIILIGGAADSSYNKNHPEYENDWIEFFQELFKREDIVNYFDISVFHLYNPEKSGRENKYIEFTKLFNKASNKPVWITETGFDSCSPDSRYDTNDSQKQRLIDTFNLAIGAEKIFWFRLIDDPDISSHSEGLLNYNLTSKDSFNIWKNTKHDPKKFGICTTLNGVDVLGDFTRMDTLFKKMKELNIKWIREDFCWFRIETNEMPPDKIVKTIPEDGSKDIALNSKIQVYFGQNGKFPVKKSCYEFIIKPEIKVTLKWEDGQGDINCVYTLIPSEALKENTKYEIIVRDKYSEDFYKWSFTTGNTGKQNQAGKILYVKGRYLYIASIDASGVGKSTEICEIKYTRYYLDYPEFGGPLWSNFKLSPDGKKIIFQEGTDSEPPFYPARPCDLSIMNVDGTGCKRLTYDCEGDIFHYSDDNRFQWFSDSKRVLYSAEHMNSFGGLSRGTVYILNIETGEKKILVENGAYASLSPDNKRIFYVVRPYHTPENRNANLAVGCYCIDASGKNENHILDITEDDYFLMPVQAWSDDSLKILLRGMVIDFNNNKYFTFTNDTVWKAVWFEDNKKFAYVNYDNQSYGLKRNIFITDINKTTSVQMTKSGDVDAILAITDKKIYYTRVMADNKTMDLWSLDLDGSNPKRLLQGITYMDEGKGQGDTTTNI